jgi:UDP-GlcNAc:undecaprenyl-phosphate/decaprenyl-phosphate GlcNAc-1-phosphate transferase
MTGAWWECAAVFSGAMLLAFVLTPVALRLAQRRDILDHPGDHKGHDSPVPYLGGLAMVTALSVAVLVFASVRPPESGFGELAAVLGMAIVLSMVGLLDDLRGLGPIVRLVVEAGAGLGVWAVGAGVEFTGSETLNAVITVVWVVGITNAFNFLDNMDGLSAGVAAIAAGSFFVIARVEGQFLVAAFAAALAGCALGFLRHNFHPARIYMGDAGSLYLGFVLAYLGLKLRFDMPEDITVLVPVIVLSVPILDVTLVTVARLRHGRSPFQGGRDHISHRLVRLGLPIRTAVGTIYVAAGSLGVIALVVSRVDHTSAYLLAGLVAVLGILAGFALGRVPVYDDDLGVARGGTTKEDSAARQAQRVSTKSGRGNRPFRIFCLRDRGLREPRADL